MGAPPSIGSGPAVRRDEAVDCLATLFSEFHSQWVEASCGGWEVVDAALGKKMRSHHPHSPTTSSSSSVVPLHGFRQKMKELLLTAIHGAAAAGHRSGPANGLSSASSSSGGRTNGVCKRPLLQPRRPSSLVLVDTCIDPHSPLRDWLMFAESLSETAVKSARRPRTPDTIASPAAPSLARPPTPPPPPLEAASVATVEAGAKKRLAAPPSWPVDAASSPLSPSPLSPPPRRFQYDYAKSRLFLDFHPNRHAGGTVGQVVRLTWMEGIRKSAPAAVAPPPPTVATPSRDGPEPPTDRQSGVEARGRQPTPARKETKAVEEEERRIIAEFRVIAPDFGTYLTSMMREEYGFLEEVATITAEEEEERKKKNAGGVGKEAKKAKKEIRDGAVWKSDCPHGVSVETPADGANVATENTPTKDHAAPPPPPLSLPGHPAAEGMAIPTRVGRQPRESDPFFAAVPTRVPSTHMTEGSPLPPLTGAGGPGFLSSFVSSAAAAAASTPIFSKESSTEHEKKAVERESGSAGITRMTQVPMKAEEDEEEDEEDEEEEEEEENEELSPSPLQGE